MDRCAIEVVSGHFILDVDGGKVLLDTGAPRSIGPDLHWTFLGRRYPVTNAHSGLTTKGLSELVGTPIDVLLGADILGEFHFLVNGRQEAIVFHRERVPPPGVEVPIELVMGIPILTVTVGGQPIRMFLDTGARLSYLRSDVVRRFPRLGEDADFYPGFGRFRTEVFRVFIGVAGWTVPLACGVLPEPLEFALLGGTVSGIIGTELFDTLEVYFSMPSRSVVLNGLTASRGTAADRPRE